MQRTPTLCRPVARLSPPLKCKVSKAHWQEDGQLPRNLNPTSGRPMVEQATAKRYGGADLVDLPLWRKFTTTLPLKKDMASAFHGGTKPKVCKGCGASTPISKGATSRMCSPVLGRNGMGDSWSSTWSSRATARRWLGMKCLVTSHRLHLFKRLISARRVVRSSAG